jgi:GDP-L-fucose synthase
LFAKKKLKFNKKFPDGTKRKVLDISIIRKLGWRSKIKLSEGLRSTINWYKLNY